jgi:hypothetical protein
MFNGVLEVMMGLGENIVAFLIVRLQKLRFSGEVF